MMKNIQVIDGAMNSAYDIFAVTEEEFRVLFPADGQDIEFIDDVIRRYGETALGEILSNVWLRKVPKSDANGIHGTLFYELEFKKQFYPTKRSDDLLTYSPTIAWPDRRWWFGPVVPILRMFDIAATRAFYVDYLGFTVDWEHRFADDLPLYMQVTNVGVTLHLSQHHGDATPGAAVRIDYSDLSALKANLDAKNYPFMRPEIEAPPWGGRELTVRDPASNRIVFVEQGYANEESDDADDTDTPL